MVETFVKTFGQNFNTVPTIPGDRDCALRINLIMEETRELFEALLNDVADDFHRCSTCNPISRSLIGIADACADLKYVIYGAAVNFGLDLSFDASHIGAFGLGKAEKLCDIDAFKMASVVSKGMEANRRFAEAVVKKDLDACKAALENLVEYTYAVEDASGIDIDPVFEEVQRSNMSKVWADGTVKKRESDGKVIKPPTYSPADIKGVLEKQIQ